MTFTYTQEQLNLFKATRQWEESNLPGITTFLVSARAGTGKSTTIEHDVIQRAKRGSAYEIFNIAFGRDIADEMNERFYKAIHIKNLSNTFNAVGFKAVRKNLNRRFIKLNQWKNHNIINGNRFDSSAPKLDIIKEYDPKKHGRVINDIIGKCKSHCYTPMCDNEHIKVRHKDLTIGVLKELVSWYGIDLDVPLDVMYEWINTALNISINQVFDTKVSMDFSDQLYITVICDLPLTRYDIVYVDEVQDVSFVQRVFLQKMLKKTRSMLVAVGDEFQAIFGFRGVDTNSILRFTELFNPTVLPLTVNMRCSKAVIMEAQKIVPDIKARENAPDGYVGPLKSPAFEEWVKISNSAHAGRHHMVICRNNAPLFELAYKMIAKRISVNFLGKDLSHELIQLIRRVNQQALKVNGKLGDPNGDVRLSLWQAALSDYTNELTEKYREKNEIWRMDAINDKLDCIKIFIDNENPSSSKKLNDVIQSFFNNNSSTKPDDKKGIRLATIHKSKGLEATNIYFLNRDLIPSTFAVTEWQLKQEQNLFYVGITRTKLNLYYCDINDLSDDRIIDITIENIKQKIETVQNLFMGAQTPEEREGTAAALKKLKTDLKQAQNQ